MVSVFYRSGDRLGVTFQFLLKVMVGGSIKYIAGMVASLVITIGNIHLIRLDFFFKLNNLCICWQWRVWKAAR